MISDGNENVEEAGVDNDGENRSPVRAQSMYPL